jgi:II/X family phage/plasmid replication protein
MVLTGFPLEEISSDFERQRAGLSGAEAIRPEYFLTGFDESREYLDSGMCDWLTLSICLTFLPPEDIFKIRSLSHRLFKISPDGEVIWETYPWEQVSSDSHQLSIRITNKLSIQGSPARLGLANNVFGSSDVRYCARKMLAFVQQSLGLQSLPPLECWSCTRIDYTRNFLMQSAAEARQALAYLKLAPERRQKHSSESNGFYIGKGSALHKGKIYLKGVDAHRNHSAGKACYTAEQLLKSEKLLRAEYTLGRLGILRLKEREATSWFDLTGDDLKRMHTEFFHEYFSEVEVIDMGNLLEKLMAVAPTEGRARAAYDCYNRIRQVGFHQAKQTYPLRTWSRHVRYLKESGLSLSDLESGHAHVVPIRRRPIYFQDAVRHWDDIPLIAAAR